MSGRRSLVEILGALQADYDPDAGTIAGLTFTPVLSAGGADSLSLSDGADYGDPERFWEAVRVWLDRSCRFLVEWTEDGPDTRPFEAPITIYGCPKGHQAGTATMHGVPCCPQIGCWRQLIPIAEVWRDGRREEITGQASPEMVQ